MTAGLYRRESNNIVVEYLMDTKDQVNIESVNLADPESAAKVDDGENITGIKVGNVMWRSPEAHAGIRIGKASDVFSFGIVVSALYTLRESGAKDQLY